MYYTEHYSQLTHSHTSSRKEAFPSSHFIPAFPSLNSVEIFSQLTANDGFFGFCAKVGLECQIKPTHFGGFN